MTSVRINEPCKECPPEIQSAPYRRQSFFGTEVAAGEDFFRLAGTPTGTTSSARLSVAALKLPKWSDTSAQVPAWHLS